MIPDKCGIDNLYEIHCESTYNAIGVSDRCECDGLSVSAGRGRRVWAEKSIAPRALNQAFNDVTCTQANQQIENLIEREDLISRKI